MTKEEMLAVFDMHSPVVSKPEPFLKPKPDWTDKIYGPPVFYDWTERTDTRYPVPRMPVWYKDLVFTHSKPTNTNKTMLKNNEGVMCASQEQWDRVTSTAKGLGFDLCGGMMSCGYKSYPFVFVRDVDTMHLAGGASQAGRVNLSEAEFIHGLNEMADSCNDSLAFLQDSDTKKTKFREGDIVVCPVKPSNARYCDPYWNNEMGKFIGKPMVVSGHSETGHAIAYGWSWNNEWLVPYTEQDDTIRVGDTVEVLQDNPLSSGHRKGDRFVVMSIPEYDKGIFIGLNHMGGSVGVASYHVKKIKAGGPASTNKTSSKDEHLRRTVEGEGVGLGKGQAVRAGSSTGQIANAGRLAGDAVSAATGKGRLGRGKIHHAAVISGHL